MAITSTKHFDTPSCKLAVFENEDKGAFSLIYYGHAFRASSGFLIWTVHKASHSLAVPRLGKIIARRLGNRATDTT